MTPRNRNAKKDVVIMNKDQLTQNQVRELIREELNKQRPLGSDFEHHQVVKETVQILHKNNLFVNEGYVVLDQVKKLIGYVKI